MEFRETQSAVQAPDIYDGPKCDQHRPQWTGSAEGDQDGPEPIGETIELAANTFPPGTRVTIEEPECPECGMVPTHMNKPGQSGNWECDCDFDWKNWADEQFS
ncbi:hypothetical protein [Labrenzia sp. DG1229]|uniref:hypothetical protein n=1 Tax=Labrenzia sp. DG1229 TaxID=681847 RepID=UPI00048D7DB1|nr:hypothetical protein [Labrenzia sp. DG1229]